MPAAKTQFGYQIRPTAAGWRWTAFDPHGQISEEGCAPSKAVAAACVIRVLAREETARLSRAAA